MSEKMPSSPAIEVAVEKSFDAQRNTELFYSAAIEPLRELTELQKETVHRHIQKQQGPWDLVDGSTVTITDCKVESGQIIFALEIAGEDVHGEIPLE